MEHPKGSCRSKDSGLGAYCGDTAFPCSKRLCYRAVELTSHSALPPKNEALHPLRIKTPRVYYGILTLNPKPRVLGLRGLGRSPLGGDHSCFAWSRAKHRVSWGGLRFTKFRVYRVKGSCFRAKGFGRM